jgi:hypothetical protein
MDRPIAPLSTIGDLSRDFQAASHAQLTSLPCICPHPLLVCRAALVPRFELGTSLAHQFASRGPVHHSKKPRISRAFLYGHGWARTSDLSRVKRGLFRARTVELSDFQVFLVRLRRSCGPCSWLVARGSWVHLQGLFDTLGHGNAPWPRPTAPVHHGTQTRECGSQAPPALPSNKGSAKGLTIASASSSVCAIGNKEAAAAVA